MVANAQNLDLEPLPELLAQVFGSSAALAGYQVMNQHPDYLVLNVPSSGVVVKLAGRASAMDAAFERTALIHRLVSTHTDIPVAEIEAVDVSYAHFPWRYLIQTRLDGKVWADAVAQLAPEQKHDAQMQIGRAVNQLHSIRFPAFGEIPTGQPGISFADALLQRAQQTIQHAHLRAWFAEVVTDRRELFESVGQAVLCHDDLHHYNILFHHDRLVGILDFDKAWAGHHETDLARLDFWDNMMGEGFREAYTAVDSGYEQRRPVYQLMWCLEYAVSTPRHRADLQHVCQELGIAPIVL